MNDGNQGTFTKLMRRNVRVVWDDPGDTERKAKVWAGVLTMENENFIELTTADDKTSLINKRYIVAISELPQQAW